MSKELEAFERIKNHTLSYTGGFYRTLTDSREKEVEDLDIIESALKDNLGFRKALEFLREDYQKLEEKVNDLERIIKEPDTTIKKLKAFEIIKEKEVNVQYFKMCLEVGWDYDLFEEHCRDNNEWEEDPPYKHSMTKEEYDLLKEVLCNGR